MGDATDKAFAPYYDSGSNADATSAYGVKDLELTYNSQAVKLKNVSLTNTTYGDAAVTSGYSTDTTNLQNYDGETHAVFYTDQDGYDLVGNNIKILQRSATVSNTLPTGLFSKPYDGTTAVDQSQLIAFLTGGTKTSGFIPTAYDQTYTITSNNLSGTYDSKNVGTNKVITITGALTAANTSPYNNYAITGGTATYNNSMVRGEIDKATLKVALASGTNTDRTYAGKNNTMLTNGLATASTASRIFSLSGVITSQTTGTTPTTTTDDVSIGFLSSTGSGEYGTLSGTTFKPTGVVGSHDVRYAGLTLTGRDAGNYKLVDTNGNDLYQVVTDGVGSNINATTGGTLYSKGEITRKNIRNAFSLQSGAATKVYDGDQYIDTIGGQPITSQTLTSSDVVSGDTVTFQVTKNSAGYAAWLTQSGTTMAATDADSGYDVTYNVQASGADADNYIFDNKTDLSSSGTAIEVKGATGTGTIQQRTVNLKLGQSTVADKDYDGDGYVYVTHNGAQTSAIALSDGLVTYADGTTTEKTTTPKTVTDKLVNGDDVSFTITGNYQSMGANNAGKDVYDTNGDGNGEAKNITYTVGLTGTKAKNYVIGSGTTITGATGAIQPATLQAKIAPVSKTYDWTTATGSQSTDTLTASSITLSGLKGTDQASDVITTSILDTLNANGMYGKGTGASFTPNEHAGSKTVQYTGLTSGSTNYKFGSSTIETTGTITPYAIDNLTMTTGTVTKVYDGKTSVATTADGVNTAKTAASYITSVQTQAKNGQMHNLSYTVADANYIDKNGTKTKNVLEATQAQFLLNITTGTDFTLSSSLAGLQSDGTVAQTASGTASITPRDITATVVNPTLTKSYDGTDSTSVTGEDAVQLFGLLPNDATNTSTGVYVGTGSYRGKDVEYDDTTGEYTPKTVNYYVTLDGGNAVSQGNYTLLDTNGNTLSYGTATQALTGTGTITPLQLTASIDTITKTFSNNDLVTGTNEDTTADAGGTVGAVTIHGTRSGDTVTAATNLSSANTHYENANVGSKNKTVYYDITFTGADVGNYTLAAGGTPLQADVSTTTSTTGNTIRAKTIKDRDIVASWTGTIDKPYDGSANVAYDNTNNATFFKDTTNGIDEQTSAKAGDYVTDVTFGGISLNQWYAANQANTSTAWGYNIDSATYRDANVGTGKTVTYQFDINADFLKNFDIQQSVKSGDLTIYTNPNGKNLFTKQRTDGAITAKYFQLNFTPLANHSQVYNGSAAIVDNTQTNPTGQATALSGAVTGLTGRVASQDTPITVDASGDPVVTGTFVDTTTNGVTTLAKDAGTNKNITYTLTLGDTNYQFYPGGAQSGTGTVAADGKSITYTGTGTITPKELTAKITAPLQKTYDGTPDILASSLGTVTFDGLVAGETLTPGLQTTTQAGLAGTYLASPRYGASDVEYDASGNVTTKALTLTNIDKALAHATGATATTLLSNYTVKSPTQTYTIADGVGQLNPLAITMSDITAGFDGGITKQYDNTDDVENPYTHYAINVNKTVNNQPIHTTLDYTLTSAKYDGGQKGVTTGHGVTYTFGGIAPSAQKNFTVGTDVQNAYAAGQTATTTGDIAPRHILASLNTSMSGTPVTKTYDGNGSITSATSKSQDDLTKLVTYSNLLSQTPGATDDGATVDVVTTFDDKNVAYDGDEVTTKDMVYTLSIGGTGNAANYAFYDQNDHPLTNNQLTDTQGGRIEPKTLTVDAVLADKNYDGKNTVKNITGSTFAFQNLERGDALQISNGAIGQNLITGTYDDKHVNRTGTGTVAAQDGQGRAYYYKGVTYTGLQDALDYMRTNENNVTAGNYKVANNGVSFTEADQRGLIRPLAIAAGDIRETWTSPIKKVYRGDANIDAPTEHLSYDILLDANGNVKNNTAQELATDTTVNIPYTLASAEYYDRKNGSPWKHVNPNGQNLTAKYVVSGLTATALNDFDLPQGGSAWNAVVATHWSDPAQTKVAITPKLINVGLGTTADINRDYDGTQTSDFANSLIINGDRKGKDTGNITGETNKVSVALNSVYGTYDSPNATPESSKNDRTLTYTAELTNNTYGDYTLDLTTHPAQGGVTTETKTLTATGTINPRALTVVLPSTSYRFDKDYDGSSDVLKSQIQGITFGNVASGESVTLDNTKLSGTYVDGSGTAAGKAQSHVHWQNGVQDWGVLLTGFEQAAAAGAGTTLSNYKISDTEYFSEAMQRGQIKQIALTMGNLKNTWSTGVAKTYGGTTTLLDANGAELTEDAKKKMLTVNVVSYTSNKGTSDESQHTIATDQPYVTYTLNRAGYDHQNAGDAHKLSYDLGGLQTIYNADATENHDFALGTLATSYAGTYQSDDAAKNIIRAKLLKVKDIKTTKVYDGTPNLKDTTVTYEDGYAPITGETPNVVIAGYYDEKNAGGRKIHYTKTLSGNTAGNYTLYEATSKGNTPGQATETLPYDNVDGHIDKRTVYVDFAGGTAPTGIDKVYGTTYDKTVAADGYDAAKCEADPTHKSDVVTLAKTDETGLTGNDGVTLYQDAIDVSYENGDVQRGSTPGAYKTTAVLFDNIQLKDADGSGDTGNYTLVIKGGTLKGSGTITPKALHVTVTNTPNIKKQYDGTKGLTSKNLTALQQNVVAAQADMMLGEGVNALGEDVAKKALGLTAKGSYDGAHANRTTNLADGKKNINYTVAWTNKNYDLTFDVSDPSATSHAMTGKTVTQATDTAGGAATFAIAQGTIAPRLLAITDVRDTTKPYTGTPDVTDFVDDYENGVYKNFTFGHVDDSGNVNTNDVAVLDADNTANAFAVQATGKYYDAADTAEDANAGVAGDTDPTSTALRKHRVRYTGIALTNSDYALADDDYTADGYKSGSGTIERATVTFTSDPLKGRFGETPVFTGTWSGFCGSDAATYGANIVWHTSPTAARTQTAPIYAWYQDSNMQPVAVTGQTIPAPSATTVAGWYQDARDGYAATDSATSYRNFGNLGTNYFIAQMPGDYTPQVDPPNTDILNPDRRFRPDMESYSYASQDDGDTAIRDPRAGIEYQAGGTSLHADGSAAYTGTMTVEGAGEVVNLTQSGTAASADRVDLTNGSANYTLSGAENVPTADVTVADVTEDVASEANTASATAAAGATSAASTTGADDTTVTDDDDDDAVKAAAESSDDREAEATVEYAGQAPSLFGEAITGTKVAS